MTISTITDDYSADRYTTGTVAVGGSVTGEIETAGDRDWFAVSFKAQRWYRFDVEGHDAGSGALAKPAQIAFFGNNGQFFGKKTTVQPGQCWQPDSDVTRYVEVSGQAGDTGGYRLSIVEIPDDYANRTDTTGAVAVGGSTTGELEHAGDRDWFKVTLEKGKTYRIDLKGKGTGDGTLADPNIGGIFDTNGRLIDATWDDDGGGGKNSRVLFTAEADGVHYIEANTEGVDWDAADRSPWMGTYTLSVVEALPDIAEDTSTTGRVAVGGSVTGGIERVNDDDWFKVTLEKGKTYTIELKGKDTGDGTLADPYLDGVYGADGNRIGASWDTDSGAGRNSLVTFTAEEGGTYYVAAGASGDKTGTYTLSVAEDPDLAADASTTGTVAVGGSATGEIERTGDNDWFAVTLEAGKTYTVELKGRPTGDGTLRDPYLDGVYDADGNRVGASWDDNGGKGRNSLVTFTAEEGGTYYVAAGASGDKTGTYTLSVAEDPDLAADASTTGTVAVGGSVTGEIERTDDSDWFAVRLEAGKTYLIDLKGKDTDDGTLEDPYLHGVFDADGNRVGTSWDYDSGEGRNSRTTVAVEADGTYYVQADTVGDGTGTYTLSVAEDAM